jgi:hypothetical protein
VNHKTNVREQILVADCSTKEARQFQLGIAINRRFKLSVFRRGMTIIRDYAARFSIDGKRFSVIMSQLLKENAL